MLPFRWLFRRVVQLAVKTKAAETAQRASSTSAPSGQTYGAESAPTPEQERCHAAVLFDLPIDLESFVSRLRGVVVTRAAGFEIHVGGLFGKRIAATVYDSNTGAADRLLQLIVAGHKPAFFVAAGRACALVESLELRDTVLASEVADDRGTVLDILLHAQPMARIHIGRLLSLDRYPRTAVKKKSLAERSGAIAVDESSFLLGDACRRLGTPFWAIRVISETALGETPRDVAHMLDQDNLVAKAGAFAGTLFRRPGSAKDMMRLKENDYEASDRLASTLVAILK